MLKYRIDPIETLTERTRRELLELMTLHYDGVNPKTFQSDLEDKTGVILLLSPQKKVLGFSTYGVYYSSAIDQRVVFSGDTVIHRDHWGSPLLFYGFGELMQALINSTKPGEDCYWFLLSKGIRTYGLLPLFFQEFYPSVKGAPKDWKKLTHQLALERFGDLFDEKRGILPFEKDRLSTGLAEIPLHKSNDPHNALFLKRNPGFTKGHELACLTAIKEENVLTPAKRFLTKGGAFRWGDFCVPL